MTPRPLARMYSAQVSIIMIDYVLTLLSLVHHNIMISHSEADDAEHAESDSSDDESDTEDSDCSLSGGLDASASATADPEVDSELPSRKQVLTCLQGFAGTGKTSTARVLIAYLRLRQTERKAAHLKATSTVVIGTTGAAASLFAAGMTAHSFAKLPIDAADSIPQVDGSEDGEPFDCRLLPIGARASLIKSISTLVCDEISMLTHSNMERLNITLQRIRGSTLPFGGCDVLFCGDLLQVRARRL